MQKDAVPYPCGECGTARAMMMHAGERSATGSEEGHSPRGMYIPYVWDGMGWGGGEVRLGR